MTEDVSYVNVCFKWSLTFCKRLPNESLTAMQQSKGERKNSDVMLFMLLKNVLIERIIWHCYMMRMRTKMNKKKYRLVAWYGNEKRVQNILNKRSRLLISTQTISHVTIYPFSRTLPKQKATQHWNENEKLPTTIRNVLGSNSANFG